MIPAGDGPAGPRLATADAVVATMASTVPAAATAKGSSAPSAIDFTVEERRILSLARESPLYVNVSQYVGQPLYPGLPDDADVFSDSDPQIFMFTMIDCGRPPELARQTLVHYLEAGIDRSRIHVVVNVHPGRATYLRECIALLQELQIPFCFYERHFSVEAKRAYADAAMLAMGCKMNDWIVHVDTDEHNEYPTGNLSTFLAALEKAKIAHAVGKLADRVSYDGKFRPITATEDLAETYPYVCNITRSIRSGNPSKLIAYKAFLVPGSGGFHGLNPYHPRNNRRRGVSGFRVHHFKYAGDIMDELKYRVKYNDEIQYVHNRELHRVYMYDALKAWGDRVCVDCPEAECIKIMDLPPYPPLDDIVRCAWMTHVSPKQNH